MAFSRHGKRFINCHSKQGHLILQGLRHGTINTTAHKNPKVAMLEGSAGCDGVLQWQLLGVDDEPRCSQVLSAFTVVASWHRKWYGWRR